MDFGALPCLSQLFLFHGHPITLIYWEQKGGNRELPSCSLRAPLLPFDSEHDPQRHSLTDSLTYPGTGPTMHVGRQYYFHRTAVTKYHTRSGLKQEILILSKF
jgi:hypothetical protein